MTSTLLNTQPSCDDDFDPDSLTCDEARRRISEHVRPLRDLEQVNIRAALGRILGTPVKSRMNVPGHINSAMDGYAINAADIPQDGIRTLAIIGSSFAGKPFSGAFALGVPCAS